MQGIAEPTEIGEVTDEPRRSGAVAVAARAGVWLVPALVALTVGRWGMLAVGIDRDESATIDISSRSLTDIWRMTRHADAVHGLYYAFMHFWTGWFGDSPFAIRLPSLIGTAIAAALLAILGTRLVSAPVGFVAGLIYATAPQISGYAHDARSYGIDSAVVIVLTMVFVAALRSPRRWMWCAYGATLVLTVTLHLFTLLLVPAHAITVAWSARSRHRWRGPLLGWSIATLAALAILAPFLHRAISQGGTASWIPPVSWGSVSDFATKIAGGGVALGIASALTLLAVVGRKPVVALTLPWLLVPPTLLLAYSVHDSLYVFRYVLYTLPALALLMATGLVELTGLLRRPAWLRWAVVPVVLVALGVSTIPMHRAVRDTTLGATDLRGQARYLAAHVRPGDALVFLTPFQREYKASYPDAYRGLIDIGEAMSPARAANFAGREVPDSVLVQRLTSVNRVFAIEYWVTASARPANRKLEAHRDNLLKQAGLHHVTTRKFRGGYIQTYERTS